MIRIMVGLRDAHKNDGPPDSHWARAPLPRSAAPILSAHYIEAYQYIANYLFLQRTLTVNIYISTYVIE